MIVDRIHRAVQARAALAAETSAYRLFDGWHEGAPGLEIDRYGHAAVIDHRDEHVPWLEPICRALGDLGLVDVVARTRMAAPRILCGDGEGRAVHEHDLRFWVEPTRAGNPGLYLDARPIRRWLRGNARGRALNLFAWTGSLGVAAATAGARVTHVDVQAAALATCARNHELNQLAIDPRDLMRVNLYQHLRRNKAGRQRYDLIIADPPPGGPTPRPKDRSPGQRGVVALAPHLARMLAPGGRLLCLYHHGDASRDEIEAGVVAAASVPLAIVWRGESGPDFPEPDERRRTRATVFERPG